VDLHLFEGEEMNAKEELTKLIMESYDRGVADQRKAVLDTIDELMGMERDRHPMFSEGYDHALRHIAQFVQARGKT
jgi:hypothetical protein